MSLALNAALLTAALTAPLAEGNPALPRAVIEAGLKKAHCTVPPREAAIIGTERLSPRLEIVEVTCWRAGPNAGSILFAVPESRPQDAQLLMVERWDHGRVRRDHSVTSPGYDAKTRTLSSTHRTRDTGDCGMIQEMKWTGWHFRLLHVWNKPQCDGEPFEWDNRESWQVFPRQTSPQQTPPQQVSPQQGLDRDLDGTFAARDERR